MSRPSQLQLLRYPYARLERVQDDRDGLRSKGRVPGSALVWETDPHGYRAVCDIVNRRPGGLPLIVVLPPVEAIDADSELIPAVQRCRPHGVLPNHEAPSPQDLAQVLRRPPLDLAAEVTDYLCWRGLVSDHDTVHLLRRIVELSCDVRSVSALARGMYVSRRALGRRLMARGLPVPSHWLQISRVLRLAVELQNSDNSVFAIAYSNGYPDGFSASNQMHRMVGCRPSQVRAFLGWEWILESWLRREADTGGLSNVCAEKIRNGEFAPLRPSRDFPPPRPGRPRGRRPVAK